METVWNSQAEESTEIGLFRVLSVPLILSSTTSDKHPKPRAILSIPTDSHLFPPLPSRYLPCIKIFCPFAVSLAISECDVEEALSRSFRKICQWITECSRERALSWRSVYLRLAATLVVSSGKYATRISQASWSPESTLQLQWRGRKFSIRKLEWFNDNRATWGIVHS